MKEERVEFSGRKGGERRVEKKVKVIGQMNGTSGLKRRRRKQDTLGSGRSKILKENIEKGEKVSRLR